MLFLRRTAGADTPAAPLPAGCTLRIWTPAQPLSASSAGHFHENWLWARFERAGLFARAGFAEVTLWHGGSLLHRLIVTPRWYRFPFMAAHDLQLGGLWTAPQARGQGLARIAVAAAHRRIEPATPLWYVCDAANPASLRLAERSGYAIVGHGRRTAPLGLRAFGRFVITA